MVSSPSLRGEIRRFLILGSANGVLSLSAFYGLSLVLPASVAFSVVYFGALGLLAVITPRFVFRARLGLARTAALATWYLCVYFAGLGMIRFLEQGLGLNRLTVTVGTVAVTSPMSFIGARLVVGRSPRQQLPPPSRRRR